MGVTYWIQATHFWLNITHARQTPYIVKIASISMVLIRILFYFCFEWSLFPSNEIGRNKKFVEIYPWFMSCSTSSSHKRTCIELPSRHQWKISSIFLSLNRLIWWVFYTRTAQFGKITINKATGFAAATAVVFSFSQTTVCAQFIQFDNSIDKFYSKQYLRNDKKIEMKNSSEKKFEIKQTNKWLH